MSDIELGFDSNIPSNRLEKIRSAWTRFLQQTDLEEVIISASLFVFTFLVLAPRYLSRKKRWGGPGFQDKDKVQVNPSFTKFSEASSDEPEGLSSGRTSTASNSSATLCTGQVVSLDEDENAEEQFEKLWPSICMSPYGHVVLPPDCKLLDKRNREAMRNSAKLASSPESEYEDDDDNPVKRLQIYFKHVLSLVRSLLYYDYVGACWTVINWLQTLMVLRSRKPKPGQLEDEDEDKIRRDTARLSANKVSIRRMSDSSDRVELVRRSSIYDAASFDDAQHDSEETLPHPPLSTVFGQLQRRSSTNRKDALESYCQSTSSTKPLEESKEYETEGDTHEDLPRRPSGEFQRQISDKMKFFDAAHSQETLKKLQVDVPVPDRNGYVLGDEFLTSTLQTPLLVFVNSRSGPQQGHLLITQLRRLLNPIQVWDLADGGPEKVLESFCAFSRLRILVCGGDGTVSWIISALEKMEVERWPPIAILPLGTGNDLARIHGWGGGYNHESLISILERVSDAYISLLDRWEMSVENKNGKVMGKKSFFNYLGVGVDAQAALQVHMLRQSKPKLFFSRAVNKAWYAIFGAEDAIKASHANLPNEMTLMADGVEVPLPPDSQGVILLNIDSYGGGVPMWSHGVKAEVRDNLEGHLVDDAFANLNQSSPRRVQSLGSMLPSRHRSEQRFARVDSLDDLTISEQVVDDGHTAQLSSCDRPSSCQDGKLDLVSVRGTFHLGQIRVGLSNAQKLCQAREIRIVLKKKMAVQIDGEPWRQHACVITVKRKKDPVLMLHRSADESGGVETEMAKLLDWAEERKLIHRDVHSILMKEFSRRIESKARQRREVKTQDNFVSSLKRAIVQSNQPPTNFPSSISF